MPYYIEANMLLEILLWIMKKKMIFLRDWE